MNVHYPLVHLHPFYRETYYAGKPPSLPASESAYKEIISYPIFPTMTDAEVRTLVFFLRSSPLSKCRRLSSSIAQSISVSG